MTQPPGAKMKQDERDRATWEAVEAECDKVLNAMTEEERDNIEDYDFTIGFHAGHASGYDAGLEEAAQSCEREAKGLDDHGMDHIACVAKSCATGIRALAGEKRGGDENSQK